MTQAKKSPEFKLIQAIIKESNSSTWHDARKEWELYSIQHGDGSKTCLCGKKNIVRICKIMNKKSGMGQTVGSKCIDKFMDISVKGLFACMARIMKHADAAPNAKLIDFAVTNNWISREEEAFSLATYKITRKKLTDTQRKTRIEINHKLLLRYLGVAHFAKHMEEENN